MSDDFAIYDAKEAVMAREIGRVIIRWARLESQFLFATAWALRLSNRQAASLLTNFKTFRLTMDFVNAAMKSRMAAENIPDTMWVSLFEYVRELSGDRNQIVHGGVSAVVHSDNPNQHLWSAHEPMISEGTNAILCGDTRLRRMPISEVTAIHDDISHALDEAMTLIAQLETPQPCLEKLSQPIVRRRPPRIQRQAGDRKGPVRPPSASRQKPQK